MENIQIFTYSLIQGITEFLPVSSSAHLYLIQDIYKWTDNALLFALGAHLGTFLALIFFNRKLLIMFRKNNLLLFAIISSFPVILLGGLIGLYGFDSFKSNLFIIAIACILGGVLLDFSDSFNKQNKNNNTIQLRDSIIVGVFQILALIPGMSRSGSVITAMRLIGINRKLSIEFSLLTGIPVLFAACSFGLYKAIDINYSDLLRLFIIVLISFISATLTIHFLFKWIEKFSLRIFSVYRVLLGIFILLYIS
tara:strand:- start:7 stop:762 length:756 start_codon:yes stop_codon:yes gene_type:complete